MKTEVVRVDPAQRNDVGLRAAVDVLSRGGLVAFPTDTVYGLGARADDAAAVARLRSVKDRAATRAFTVHIGSRGESDDYLPSRLNGVAGRLARRGWPGPVTLIIPVPDPTKTPCIQRFGADLADVIFYDGTVGLRCPDHPAAQSLLAAVDAPVVAASANRAKRPPPRNADEVLEDLGGAIDLVVDAGPTRYAKASTIVRTEGRAFEILRDGVYDARAIQEMAALRLLFVCTGNTCRSPMAEALARAAVAKRLECAQSEIEAANVHVGSAGTFGGGAGAAAQAVAVMRARGIDLTGHRPRALTVELIQQADYIFAMTDEHRKAVVSMVPSAADRTMLLLEDAEVGDPIGGTAQDYEASARVIEQGLEVRLKEIAL